MEFAENEFISSVDELCSKVPIISDYCNSLDGNVKRRYLEKVAVIAVDPITIPDEHSAQSVSLRWKRWIC